MKSKIMIITLAVLSIIAIIIGIVFLNKNIALTKSNLEIIDATYSCVKYKEKIYEDDEYIYYSPCQNSNSLFVKFKDTNSKILVKNALEEKKVTIKELLDAGLDVEKVKK